jgi:hypothetical protein
MHSSCFVQEDEQYPEVSARRKSISGVEAHRFSLRETSDDF